ncbi:Stk1 family PASTA domain-containing Ser/Thr kinase [Okibacterium fritillariae]|uniref:non-specific serine/threonine protein kinase n=1 Tax=Okibacterium fritillariae TaxID=123320 RepID=A0A1T5I8A4_9MICO|nr:Stk1 family PASTA domain-containing Ser/Thr kinase [Okibacterium fritillariae]SKC35377.1 serine/threonine protein kinase [Okibacterium fritillariae]
MADDQRVLAGRYLVGDLIGHGGMAEVFRGTDTRLGRTVAIKILRSELATDPAFRTRFRQEAQAASRMAHPTIVRVYDAGEETTTAADGRTVREPFIVMEYVEGRTLKAMIAEGPIEQTEAVRISEGILTALEYSHRAGVVHRDIKPGNIMITPDGRVKVMDFGIARAVSDSSTTVAQTTAILGTAAYFSPEQAKGETVDARTDLYSTGVVLFEMLTGRAPFRGDTAVAVAYQHVSETPVKPSSVNPQVSPALDVVVLRALHKGRNDRYQTAAEFRDDLVLAGSGKVPLYRRQEDASTALFGTAVPTSTSTEQALRQLTTDTTVTRTQRRPPVVWIWAGIAAVAVMLLAVMFWVVTLPTGSTLPTDTRTMPNVVNVAEQDALDTLNGLDLVPVVQREASDTVDPGIVIRTDPAAGLKVPREQSVRVTVSSGPEQAVVPEVTGQGTDAAVQALQAAGLVAGSQNKENSPTVPADTVMRSDPAAGTPVEKGSTVNLIVSSGLVTISDVRGQILSVATEMMSDPAIGLTVAPKPDPSCPAQANSPVTNQSLAPGDVPQGSTIELSYCSGGAPSTPSAPAPDEG